MARKNIPVQVDRERAVRKLRDLIDALDRRVPHVERVGERRIAQDAAELKKKAMERIAQLESTREPSPH
jgi:hypothetical protein